MGFNWIKQLQFWSKQNKKDRRKKDDSFDNQLLEMDFYSQLAYLSAISSSGIDRDKLVYYAAKLP